MNTTTTKRAARLAAIITLITLPLRAENYYWDLNGNGTWDSGQTAAWAATAAGGAPSTAATTAADTVYFSANGITAGTITIAGTQLANQIWLNQPGFDITFSGGMIDLTTGAAKVFRVDASGTITNNLIKTGDIYFQSINQTLTLTGGAVNNFFNGKVYSNVTTGGTSAAQTSTLVLQSGTYTSANSGGLSYNIGNFADGTAGVKLQTGAVENTAGSWHVGGSGGEGVFRIEGGTKIQPSGNVVIGRDSTAKGYLIVDSGTLRSDGNNTDFLVGFNNAQGKFEMNGGVAQITGLIAVNNNNKTNAEGYGLVTLNGGVTTAKGLVFGVGDMATWTTLAGTGSLTMNGGRLNLGASGIANTGEGTSTYGILLAGGTLGATAAWSSDLQMTLGTTATTTGITLDTAGGDITLSGVLDGDGNLTKAGTGTLLLSGANTYEGDTIVDAGTLELGNAAALGIEADLSLLSGVTVNLNYTGTAEIDHLLLDGVIIDNLIVDTAYTTAQLNTILGNDIFTGNGQLTISAIPEPSTWLLLAIGAGVLAISRRSMKR
jgi:autotransporter-associated beta strand protein